MIVISKIMIRKVFIGIVLLSLVQVYFFNIVPLQAMLPATINATVALASSR